MLPAWKKFGGLKRRSWPPPPRKDRSALTGVDPRAKQIAFDRLALLHEYQRRLSNPGGLKTKAKVTEKFLADIRAGLIRPEGALKFISHLSRSGLYKWIGRHKVDGIRGLVSRYKYKENSSTPKPTFRMTARPFEMKLAGRPRRNGKIDFRARLKRHWKNPRLEGPIYLKLAYSMPIPKETHMPQRKKILRGEVSHIRKPNLDALNAFVVDCLTGIVFKSHSQIVQFTSEKRFASWAEVIIKVRELKG